MSDSAMTIDQLEIELSTTSTDVTAALDKLEATLNKLRKATGNTSDETSKLNSSLKLQKAVANGVASSLNKVGSRLLTFAAISKVASLIGSAINKSTEYVESLNLFTVALGNYAQEAQNYAETVSEVMGIDPAEWLKAQGVFQTITTGFGVAEDRAYTMSKNLTQLGYDISSFYNLDVQDSFNKLTSAISGELEPVRRLGYDLSVTRLQQEALNLGITKSVSAMTQAEKAELRYYTLMQQATLAQQDMARTLNSPSNQLRILQAQLSQTARAIGNIFIPALNTILPWAIAAAKAIRALASTIASLFGYTLPEVDYSTLTNVSDITSGIADSVDDTSSGLGSAANNAKKLKDYMLGIDELNVISPDDSTGSGGSGGSGGGGSIGDSGLGFELPSYDFLGNAVSSKVDEIYSKHLKPYIEWIEDHLNECKAVVEAIGAAFLTWKVSNTIANLINGLGGNISTKQLVGVTMMVTGITLGWESAYSIGFDGLNFMNGLNTVLGGVLTTLGAYLTFGSTGVMIALPLYLTMTIARIYMGWKDKQVQDELARRFGDLILSDQQINALVEQTFNSKWYSSVKLAVELDADAKELSKQVASTVREINRYQWLVRLGVGLNKEQSAEYKSQLQNLVTQSQEFISKQGYALEVGIKATIDNEELATQLSDIAGENTSVFSGILSDWGSELSEYVNLAFNDELFNIDYEKQIEKLTTQIAGLQSAIAEGEANSVFTSLLDKWSFGDLSEDTWNQFYEELQSTGEQMKTAAKEARDAVIQGFEGQISGFEYMIGISDTQEEKDKWQGLLYETQNALNEYLADNSIEIRFQEIDWKISETAMQHFNEVFGDMLERNSSVDVIDALSGYAGQAPSRSNYGTDVEYQAAMQDYINRLKDGYETLNPFGVEVGEKGALEKYIGDLVPTKEALSDALNKAWEAGNAVTQSVRDGLTDVYTYKLMSGDTDAMYYFIGQNFANSDEFVSTLGTANQSAYLTNEAFADGFKGSLSFVYDAATGTYAILRDGVEVGRSAITNELVENMEALGVDIADAFMDGLMSKLSTKSIKRYLTNSSAPAFEASSPLYYKGASNLMSNLQKAISDNESSATSELKVFANNGVEVIAEGSVSMVAKETEAMSQIVSEVSAKKTPMTNTVKSALVNPIVNTLGSSDTLNKMKSSGKSVGNSISTGITNSSYGGLNALSYQNLISNNVITPMQEALSSSTNTNSIKTAAKNIGVAASIGATSSSYGGLNADTYSGYGKNAVTGVNTGVNNNYKNVYSYMKTFANYVNDTFKGITNSSTFSGYGKNTVSGMSSGVNDNYKSVYNNVKKFADYVNDTFKGVANTNTYSGYGKNLISGMSVGLNTNYKDVYGYAKKFADYTNSSFTGATNSGTYKGYGKNLVSGVNTGVNDNYKNVKTYMNKFADMVNSGFYERTGWNTFSTYGKYVVDGFIDGLNSKAYSINKAMQTFANLVTRTFTAKIQIKSPSRLFKKFGGYTVEGYNLGVEAEQDKTKKVLEKWSDKITSFSVPALTPTVDTSAIRNSIYGTVPTVSAEVATTASVKSEGYKDEMKGVFTEYFEPILNQIASDTKRQADKSEKTEVNINGKTLASTVNKQNRANGYVFA